MSKTRKVDRGTEWAVEQLRGMVTKPDAKLKAEIEEQVETIRRGRKPFPSNRLRKHRIMTYFNDAEINAVIDAAGERETAEFLRELILNAIRFGDAKK